VDLYSALLRSGMARVIGGSHLHTLRSSANRMNHTCLCLPSRSSFTDPGGMQGRVGLVTGTLKILQWCLWRLRCGWKWSSAGMCKNEN